MNDALASQAAPGTPQTPRYLVRAEFNIVLEDLKHGGVSPRTLKTLLPKMYAGLEAGTPADQWGLEPEEDAAYAALTKHLEGLGAALPPVTVASTNCEDAPALTPSAPVTHIKWRTPFDEISGTARIAADLLARDPDLAPGDICVVVPNTMWAFLLKSEFDRKRIPVQQVLDTDAIGGDPRVRSRMGTLEAYAFVALAANPEDLAAWRLWLALGVPDFACAAWKALTAYADERGESVRDALASIDCCDEPPFEGAARLAERAQEAEALMVRTRGKKGFALRNLVCHKFTSPQVKELLDLFEGDEDMPALFAGLQKRSFEPSFANRPSQLRMGMYRTVRGTKARYVLLPGLIDGLVPTVDAATHDAARRDFARALGMASDAVFLSHFQHIGVEQATQLRLPTRRTRSLKGADVAAFSPSPFIDEAGDALPGSVSGEQYFSDSQE